MEREKHFQMRKGSVINGTADEISRRARERAKARGDSDWVGGKKKKEGLSRREKRKMK